VGQGLLLTGIGVLIGVTLAAYGMPLAKSLLYKVSPLDPISFGSVAAFLAATALIASVVPALRATRVDPVIALRAE
jgi:putative ABC transport system permease protein